MSHNIDTPLPDFHNIRDYDVKTAFVAYMIANPKERFWQSLRNFSGWYRIWAEVDDTTLINTFYREGDGARAR